MKMFRPLTLTFATALAVAGMPASSQVGDSGHSEFRYRVDIVNLSKEQRFTPFLLATHRPDVSLFHIGQPASAELATLAEEGNTGPLDAALSASPEVNTVVTGNSLTQPGQHAVFEISGSPFIDRLSLAAMLIPTNDAFVALRGGRLPAPGSTVAYTLYAYDSGSERNDELCASIPGPDFGECGGAGGGGAPAGGEEGFVHVHNGIHGVGDFDAARRDWRNPIAIVTINAQR